MKKNVVKLVIMMVILMVVANCSSVKGKDDTMEIIGDSITSSDGVDYYWYQYAVDSACISAVEGDKIIKTCLVTGPLYGAFSDEDGNFLIDCGEDQYYIFNTRLFPNVVKLMTEEEAENYNIEDEHADLIINLE